MPEHSSKKTIGDFVRIIFRRRVLFFLPSAFFMVAVLIGGLFVPRKYTGKAVFERRTDMVVSMDRRGKHVSPIGNIRSTIREELIGHRAVELVVQQLRLTKGFRDSRGELTREGQLRRMDLINKIRSKLRMGYDIRTRSIDMVHVGFTNQDPELCRRLVNLVVENYLKRVRNQIDAELTRTFTFMQSQVEKHRREIERFEKQRLEMEMANPGISPDDPSSVHTRRLNLELTIQERQDEITRLQNDIESYKEMLEQPELIEGVQGEAGEAASEEEEELIRKIKNLEDNLEGSRRDRKTDRHPDVKLLKLWLDKTRTELEDLRTKQLEEHASPSRRFEKLRPEIRLKLQSGRASLKSAQENLARTEEELQQVALAERNFFKVRRKFQKLEEALSSNKKQLGEYQGKMLDLERSLSQELERRGINYSFVRPCEQLFRPSWPPMWMVFGLAFGGGMFLATFLVVWAEYSDYSFRSIEDVSSYIDVPVLGATCQIVNPQQRRRQRLIHFVGVPLLVVLVIGTLAISAIMAYLSLNNPSIYDQLRENPSEFVQRVMDRLGEMFRL